MTTDGDGRPPPDSAAPPETAAPPSSAPLLDQAFDAGSLYALRAAVAAHATQAGLPPGRADDLVIAVHELASNAVRHGAGHGRLRIWRSDQALHCEISDDGLPEPQQPSEPQKAPDAAKPPEPQPPPDAPQWRTEPGHGLSLVRQVADHTSLSSGRNGTSATISFTLATPGPDFHLARHDTDGCTVLAVTGPQAGPGPNEPDRLGLSRPRRPDHRSAANQRHPERPDDPGRPPRPPRTAPPSGPPKGPLHRGRQPNTGRESNQRPLARRGRYSRPCSSVTTVMSRFRSLSERPNVSTLNSGRIRCRVIDLGRENSRSPSAPWIRPNPDSPPPPNGSAGTTAKPSTEFTDVIPVRSDRAADMPARRSRVNTAEPSPYRPALAYDTASAMFTTDRTVSVGPNVSSETARLFSGTSVSTTGSTYGAETASRPPTTARPPRASASATCLATTSVCDGSVIGP